jgi:integrase
MSLISKIKRDDENKYCLLLAIGVFTSLRIGDLLQLRFSQFENGKTFIIVEKKTKKTRMIKINQDLNSILIRVKKMNGLSVSF